MGNNSYGHEKEFDTVSNLFGLPYQNLKFAMKIERETYIFPKNICFQHLYFLCEKMVKND